MQVLVKDYNNLLFDIICNFLDKNRYHTWNLRCQINSGAYLHMTWVRCEQCTASPVGVLFWDYSNLFLDTKNYFEIKIDRIFGTAIIDLGLRQIL